MSTAEIPPVIESTPVRTVRNLKKRQSDFDVKQGNDSEDDRSSQLQPVGLLQRQPSSKPSTTSSASINSYTDFIPDATKSTATQRLPPARSGLDQSIESSKSQQQVISFKRRPQKNPTVSATLIQRKPSQSEENQTSDNRVVTSSLSSTTSPVAERDVMLSSVQQAQTFSGRIDSLRVSLPLNSVIQEGPLGDKTNTMQEKRGFRRSKAKMPTTKELLSNKNEVTADDNTATTVGGEGYGGGPVAAIGEIKEYINIDMDYAVHFIVSKSKVLRELVNSDDAFAAKSAQNVVESRIFRIEYGAFLQKQVQRKVISQDFRNVSKKAFDKLEKFVMERLKKQEKKVALQSSYVKSSKSVQSLFDARIASLKGELADQMKLCL